MDGCVIGPDLLPPNLTGDAYLKFLKHILHWLLEDVPLHVCQNMWFQHDGAPPHYTAAVTGRLDQRFGQTWIDCDGSINWPSSSPNLHLLTYFLWGHVKSLVYKNPRDCKEDLLEQVMALVDIEPQDIGDCVYENMVSRYHVCVEVTSSSSCK